MTLYSNKNLVTTTTLNNYIYIKCWSDNVKGMMAIDCIVHVCVKICLLALSLVLPNDREQSFYALA